MFYGSISPLKASGAGIVSVLSPCILPLLPAVLATSAGKDKLRPLAIVLGVSISFTAMGVVTSTFGAVRREAITWIAEQSAILSIQNVPTLMCISGNGFVQSSEDNEV